MNWKEKKHKNLRDIKSFKSIANWFDLIHTNERLFFVLTPEFRSFQQFIQCFDFYSFRILYTFECLMCNIAYLRNIGWQWKYLDILWCHTRLKVALKIDENILWWFLRRRTKKIKDFHRSKYCYDLFHLAERKK